MNQFSIRKFLKVSFGAKMKALLLFLASLGLPSLFLLFLAIRGIENDQALEEQKLLSHHSGIADSLATEVDKEISSAEKRLQSLFEVIANRDQAGQADLLEEFASWPLINELFILKDDHLQFPLADLLYDNESKLKFRESIQSRGVELARLIEKAEKAEFQTKDYNRAAELYRSALSGTKDNNTRADLLMRIARVSSRAGDFPQATKAFRIVSKEHSQSRLPGGLPGGLAARLELAGLFHRTGESVGAMEMLHKLYRDLLASRWTLNRSQFGLARNKIESVAASLDSVSSGVDINSTLKIEVLSSKADSLVSRTDFLLNLSVLVSQVIPDLRQSFFGKEIRSSHRVIEDNDHQYLLLLAGGSERSDDNIIFCGALLDDDALLNDVVSKIVNSLPLGENHSLVIKNNMGERLYGLSPPNESRWTATRGFEGDFPPWSIELHQVDPKFFEQIISSRRSIYVYALVIVMVALTLGAIMTARIMTRELELARLKSDFVSTVSHEFRSPLTSIRQLSEMLQSGRVQNEERRKHYYGVILEQSERLSLMVSNILDLARIDERHFPLNRESIRIEELLGAIVTRVGQLGGDEKAQVRLCIKESLPNIKIDPEAITHVMNNLIDNALKYSGESPEIIVTAFHDESDLFITVKDNGIGIPESEADRVFERFFRGGDELTRKIKGSGLGLSLVRELVEAHGGKVSVVSEVNKGSLFTICLPLRKDEGNKNG